MEHTILHPGNIPAASTAVGTPVGSPVSKVIGTSGGVLYSPDSILKLTIPAGALSANTNINIQPVWTWTPDPYGMIDVAGLSLNHETIMDDSVVTVYAIHGNATQYGYVLYTNGVLVGDDKPSRFVASYGIPPTFVIELKNTPPYLKTLAGGGKSVSYAILPKQ